MKAKVKVQKLNMQIEKRASQAEKHKNIKDLEVEKRLEKK